jgi:exodeoxyribonuclease-3
MSYDMLIKIATWNVNSIKSRLEHVVDLLRSDDRPDILLLQELKCTEDNFPLMEIEDTGYNVRISGQKTYNGVAIISKYPIDETIKTLPLSSSCANENILNSLNNEARYIESVISLPGRALRVASVYVPNGQEVGTEKFYFKLEFLKNLHAHAENLLKYDEILIIGGDFNVAPDAIDVFDAKSLEGTICCHKDERKYFRSLINLGLTDIYRTINPNVKGFSWWDYRAGAWQHNKGMRIDHLLLSPAAADITTAANINLAPRNKDKPSDHTPVWCELKI